MSTDDSLNPYVSPAASDPTPPQHPQPAGKPADAPWELQPTQAERAVEEPSDDSVKLAWLPTKERDVDPWVKSAPTHNDDALLHIREGLGYVNAGNIIELVLVAPLMLAAALLFCDAAPGTKVSEQILPAMCCAIGAVVATIIAAVLQIIGILTCNNRLARLLYQNELNGALWCLITSLIAAVMGGVGGVALLNAASGFLALVGSIFFLMLLARLCKHIENYELAYRVTLLMYLQLAMAAATLVGTLVIIVLSRDARLGGSDLQNDANFYVRFALILGLASGWLAVTALTTFRIHGIRVALTQKILR